MPDDASTPGASQIAELKVSGHMMSLEPGVYCVFSAQGGPAPSPHTGLPIVRIGAAYGQSAGQVKVAGLDADGWVGPESATLVHVADRRAHLLVTVYQEANTTAEAPSIQVVRLHGAPEAAAVPQTAPVPEVRPANPAPAVPDDGSIEVVGHIYARGDVGGALGEWMGEPGSKRWVEGFRIAPSSVPAADLEYQAVLGRGWLSPWSEGGQFCGSRGMSLPILGLRVRLRGASAQTHKVVLSATFVDGTEVGPVGDGDPCEAPSLAALEAFHVAIVPKVAAPVKAAPVKAETKKAAVKATRAAPAPAPKAAKVKAPAPVQPVKPPKAKAPAPKAPAPKASAPKAPEPKPAAKPAARRR